MEEDTLTKEIQAFKLKANSYNLTTLQLLTNDFKQLAKQLTEKINLAPNFFKGSPIVIDLSKLYSSNHFVDFKELRRTLYSLEFLPIGIKNANLHHEVHARSAGFAILGQETKSEPKHLFNEQNKSVKDIGKLILEPVRSGQQIINPNGDLTIRSSVGHGAEVVAHGHIHIYGSLKGKAIAGMTGLKSARIFCSSLEAELVSIGGIFMASEDIESKLWKKPATIYVKNDLIRIEAL